MLVTADRYQLPLDLADTLRELSHSTGLSYSGIKKVYHGETAIRLPKGSYAAAKGYIVKVNFENDPADKLLTEECNGGNTQRALTE